MSNKQNYASETNKNTGKNSQKNGMKNNMKAIRPQIPQARIPETATAEVRTTVIPMAKNK